MQSKVIKVSKDSAINQMDQKITSIFLLRASQSRSLKVVVVVLLLLVVVLETLCEKHF